MTEARKNGTKPTIPPFRLCTKPSIKDAPIFDDIDFGKKKRPFLKKINALKRRNSDETLGTRLVKESVEETSEHVQKSDINPFGKTTPGSAQKSPGTQRKFFGDPYKDKTADPFEIMTAEPDEEDDAPVEQVEVKSGGDLNAEQVKEVRDEAANIEEARKISAEPSVIEEVKQETREEDILEINAEIDSTTLKDTDDNIDEDIAKPREEKESKDDKKSSEKRHKKRKKSEKSEKGEKKKKRRKESNKSEEESHDKRHKKRRRRDRSRSTSSSRRRRNRRDQKRSREQSPNKLRKGSNRRDSPDRFGSHQRSRSRSPIRRAWSPRHGLPDRNVSPKRRTKDQEQSSPPRKRSPAAISTKEKLPREKFPRDRSPKEKSPKKRSSTEKSPRLKSPKQKSPRDKFLRERSPKRLDKGGKSWSTEAKSIKERDTKDKSPKSRRKSREEKSPKKKFGSQSPRDSTRKKTDSDNSASFVQDVASQGELSQTTATDNEVKESDMSMSPNFKKSLQASSKPQLKSYVQVVAKDPAPPVRIVPYLEDDEVVSISPRDSVDGLKVKPDEEIINGNEVKLQSQKAHKSKESKHKGSAGDETEPTKKVKVKKKSKKSQEKKRKKKTQGKQIIAKMERNTDDELEDLLFTKTNKEEEVFNDSEIFSAKHNLRTAAVVDLDMKKLKTVGSPMRKEASESKKLSSVILIPEDSPEPYEPEKLSEISEAEKEIAVSEDPPAQSGFSTIPFLSVDEESEVIEYGEQHVESDNAAYSPVEQPIDNESYSPVEHPISDFGSPKKSSTMNLSDISNKDTVVKDTVGVITTAEKVEDFLGRIQPPEEDIGVVDMDMSSPTNGFRPNSEEDDDIIEQLHKEFVRTQHQEDTTPGIYVDNLAARTSSIPQSIPRLPSIPSPLHTAATDPIVQAYGFSTNYGTITKPKHHKRAKKKSRSSKHKEEKPFADEKKDIEDALNRVHRQARVEDEMKHALKVYFKRKDITKEEYKMILRKGVPQVANSNHGIDPERIRSLVKKYVAKYKASRQRRTKAELREQPDVPFTFSP